MNLTGFLACIIVALDCMEKALGIESQQLFAPQNIWVWWFPVAFWSLGAIGQLGR